MENFDSFALRHIGLSQKEIDYLLDQLGYKDLEEFSKSVLPKNIFTEQKLELGDAMSEEESLKALKEISKKTVFDLDNLENQTDNEILLEKIERVKTNIKDLDYEKINDNTISKFLTISQLGQEIMESK